MTFADSHAETLDATVQPAVPRPEHPRPDFVREPWINLNGRWRFTFDPTNEGEQRRWHRLSHPDSAAAGQASSGAPSDMTTQARGYLYDLSGDPFRQQIVVPFPWESPLSEIGDTEYKGAAFYQRAVTVPLEWAEPTTGEGATPATRNWRLRPFLCFGAVDWHARVWVNGRFVGEHAGGYSPFAIDISPYVTPGKAATVCVRAYDACDADTCLGKQTYDWYTHSGGIWQTVWMEGRPAAFVEQIHVTPDLDNGRAQFDVSMNADQAIAGRTYQLSVTSPSGAFAPVTTQVTAGAEHVSATLSVSVPNAKPWSPEEPNLYDCQVALTPVPSPADGRGVPTTGPVAASREAAPESVAGTPRPPAGEGTGVRASDTGEGADVITTYFGLRKISRGRWQDNPYEFVFLNDEPVYLRGALDQAFTPEGLHTYASDDAIRADVQLAKDLGLNMLRCHIKINEPRYYYWADKLGVLVMYDIPSTGAYNPSARRNWEQTFRDALARDYSHPSIFSWILFNETWGLEEHQTAPSWKWVAEMFDLAKALDPTRLVEDNSACLYDHVRTDLNTWHFYISDYDRARRHIAQVVRQVYEGSPFNYVGRFQHLAESKEHKQGTEPFLNSEYAGLGASGGDKDISYSFKFLTTDLRRHNKVCGYVYTELTDIEWEHNGYANYDRSPKEFGYDAFVPGMSVADLNGADFVGLDCAPCQTLAPGATFAAAAFVSHWGKNTFSGQAARVRWQVSFVDRFGDKRILDDRAGAQTVSGLHRYGVTDAGEIAFTLPGEPGLLSVALYLEDDGGIVHARNYVNVDVSTGERLPARERTPAGGHALRLLPADFVESSWPQPVLARNGAKFAGRGAGYVEYSLALPDDLDPARVSGLRLVFEAGARTASSRLGWKREGHSGTSHYPQTETQTKLPTDLSVRVNGVPIGQTVRLPDDPADARGVLSLHSQDTVEFASYGFLTILVADADAARQALAAAAQNGQLTLRFEITRTGTMGGLSLYGERMGAFPVAPTLIVE